MPVDLPLMSMEDVAKHNSLESLWVVIDGEVYDLTGWAKLHPGGVAILERWAGKDASSAFHNAAHTAATQIFRLNYRIGRIAQAQAKVA